MPPEISAVRLGHWIVLLTPRSLMNRPKAEFVPYGLRLLIDAAGEAAALKIVQARGGTRLFIPRTLEHSSLLQSLVGNEAAAAIVRSLSGAVIEVPMAKRFVNAKLRGQGDSQQQRARKLRVSLRTVKSWDSGKTPSWESDFPKQA